MLLLVYFNSFLSPAMIALPAIYLMKIYKGQNHVKISMLMIFAAGLGYILSYAVSAKYSHQVMSGIICGGSCLYGLVIYLGKESIFKLEKSNLLDASKTSKKSFNTTSKILAGLVW